MPPLQAGGTRHALERSGVRRGIAKLEVSIGCLPSRATPRCPRLAGLSSVDLAKEGSFIHVQGSAGFDRTPGMAIFPAPTLTLPSAKPLSKRIPSRPNSSNGSIWSSTFVRRKNPKATATSGLGISWGFGSGPLNCRPLRSPAGAGSACRRCPWERTLSRFPGLLGWR
jgi:hypothetical protein